MVLDGDAQFFAIDTGFLNDGSCAILATFLSVRRALPSLKKIEAAFGHYTQLTRQVPGGTSERVSLSISEPRTMWVPVLDPTTGQRLDSTETLEECERARTMLGSHFAHAAIDLKQWPSPSRGCYIELGFKTNLEFEAFFDWPNPYSLDGSLVAINFRRATGVISTVELRPVSLVGIR